MTDENKRAEVLQRLNEVFREVFDNDALVIEEATSATDIADWDSLMHITLCVAVEREFNTRLNAAEIARLENVGSWVSLLTGKGTK